MYSDKSRPFPKDASQFSTQHHVQHADTLPASRDTSFAAELQQPLSAELATPAAPLAPTPNTHEVRPAPSPASRVLRFATTLVSSNNFYTSVGNVIITSNLWTGVLLQPACALLAIANEAREKGR